MTVAANVKQVLTILFVRLLHTALLESAALMVFLLAQAVYMFDVSPPACSATYYRLVCIGFDDSL